MPEHQQTQQSKKTNTIFQNQATPVRQTPVSNPYSIIQRAKINPRSLTRADIMQLHRTIGNQAVGRLLSSIGSSSTAQHAPVQRQEMPEEEKCPSCMQRQEIPEEEEPLQGKMTETLQRQEIPEEEEPLQTKKENNTGMPDNLKAGVENLSGIDMSDVRVHYNSDKPAEVGALAYTQGTNIHVASGQERHLPHEAWHVVQQAQRRVRPTLQMKGVLVNDDEGLEHEADSIGRRALQMKPDDQNKSGDKSGAGQGFGFVDNRPEAVVERKLHEVINFSPQIKQLEVIHEISKNNSQAKQVTDLKARTVQLKATMKSGGTMVLPPQRDPKREIYYPKPKHIQDLEEMATKAQEYVEQYIAEHGVHPVIHKIQKAQERAKGGSEYKYVPSDEQRREAEIGYLQARHQLRQEAERRQFNEQYLKDTVHGGFEERAATAVGRVQRDKPERIVNYAEVTRQSEVEDGEWILIDHKICGPRMSGSAGHNMLKQGPYQTANPSCADPKVQDDIRQWVRTQREGDQEAGRTEDRVDVQFYDDKAPCDTCEHNIPAQVQNDQLDLDLFLAEKQDEARGEYSGATFNRHFEHDGTGRQVALATRNKGMDHNQVIAEIDKQIVYLKQQTEKELEKKKWYVESAGKFANNKSIPENRKKEMRTETEKNLSAIESKLTKIGDELKELERQKDEIKRYWPPITKK